MNPSNRSLPSNSAQEISRVKSSPAIPVQAGERVAPSEVVSSQRNADYVADNDREEQASLSSVSVLTTDNISAPNSISTIKASKTQKNKNPYSNTSKKNSKPKKENNKLELNSPPPNFDMLAKFALEKERLVHFIL